MYSYIDNRLDYKAYHSLRESVGWKNFSEIQAREAIGKSTYIITAIENEDTIAMARLIGDGLYYIISDVIVKPKYQGQGIGKTMIRRLLSYVEEKLPEGGRVSVFLISEQGKESFYEQFGFKKIPHEFCGFGMRKVICS